MWCSSSKGTIHIGISHCLHWYVIFLLLPFLAADSAVLLQLMVLSTVTQAGQGSVDLSSGQKAGELGSKGHVVVVMMVH